MEDVQITVFGWVGTDPEFHSGQGYGDRVTFRLASTPRFFDRGQGSYRDQETVWLGVKVWRGLAHNVASSVHKGDPVVVVGRLRAQVYKADGEDRRYQELEATTVGHDLTKGTSMFARTKASQIEMGTRSPQPGTTARTRPTAVGVAPEGSVTSDDLRPLGAGEGAGPSAQPAAAEPQPGAA